MNGTNYLQIANDPFRLVTCCLISNNLVDLAIILQHIEIKYLFRL